MICPTCGADPCVSKSTCAAAKAEAAWNGPGWGEAAEEYRRSRSKSRFTCRTPEEFDAWLAAERKAGRELESPETLRARRLLAEDVSFERACGEINDTRGRPTPKSTVEAVMSAVRERGVPALKEPATLERLLECDERARAEINDRIAALVARKRVVA
jgi:hypothetical protein